MLSAPRRLKINPDSCAERKPFCTADFFSGLLAISTKVKMAWFASSCMWFAATRGRGCVKTVWRRAADRRFPSSAPTSSWMAMVARARSEGPYRANQHAENGMEKARSGRDDLHQAPDADRGNHPSDVVGKHAQCHRGAHVLTSGSGNGFGPPAAQGRSGHSLTAQHVAVQGRPEGRKVVIRCARVEGLLPALCHRTSVWLTCGRGIFPSSLKRR